MSWRKKMDNVNENPVDSSQDASGSEEVKSEQQRAEDVVKYESYKKVLSEAKNAKERARELEAQLEAKKNAELEAKGNYQEIIENLKHRLSETEEKYITTKKQALWKDVTGAIKQEASKAGCINPDKLIRLLDKNDLSQLQAEDGTLMDESVKALVEKAKKEDYYLFSKGQVPVMDATPNNNDFKPKKKDVKDMTAAERLEEMKSGFREIIK